MVAPASLLGLVDSLVGGPQPEFMFGYEMCQCLWNRRVQVDGKRREITATENGGTEGIGSGSKLGSRSVI